MGRGLFEEETLRRIYEASRWAISRAFEAGCLIAVGSDAGAVGVPHGVGCRNEYECFVDSVSTADIDLLNDRLAVGEQFIRDTFRRHG